MVFIFIGYKLVFICYIQRNVDRRRRKTLRSEMAISNAAPRILGRATAEVDLQGGDLSIKPMIDPIRLQPEGVAIHNHEATIRF